ncbi:MAG: CPBP family intramembrane glutamic endopeptidase [Polyangiales bacterium]|nr:CPBP family intramembrane metalloprotease [Myxococcales bacterium]
MQRDKALELSWWAAPFLTVLGFAGMYFMLFVAAFIRSATGTVTFGEGLGAASEDLVTIGFAQLLGYGAVILGGVRMFGGERPVTEALGLVPVPWRALAAAVVFGVAFQFVLSELGNIASIAFPLSEAQRLRMEQLLSAHSLSDGIAMAFALVVVAPVTEELLFRGVLFRGLAVRYGAPAAALASALLFGVSHMVPAVVISATAAGVVFAVVVWRFGSVAITMAIHMTVNAVPMLLPKRVLPIPGFNTFEAGVEHLPLPVFLIAAIVSVGAAYVLGRVAKEPA